MASGVSTRGTGGAFPRLAVAGALALSATLAAEPRAEASCSRLDHLVIGTGALLALPPGLVTSLVASGIARASQTRDFDVATGLAWGMLGTAAGAGTGALVAIAAGCPSRGPILPAIFGVTFAAGAVIAAHRAAPERSGSAADRLVQRPAAVRIPLLVIAF